MNLKKLYEQRTDLQKEMQALLDGANAEERAMTAEESTKFDEIEGKIKAIDATIKAEERARDLDLEKKAPEETPTEEQRAESEERAFEDYIRGVVSENRANNLVAGSTGAVIPKTIAQKIITKVYEISPIFAMSDKYPVAGTLSIPYYDETSESIEMAYATEFTDLTTKSGEFKSIELKGFLGGALTKVSRSLVNNAQFDIVTFVVNRMAEAIAKWLEGECINGTSDKIDGLSKAKNVVTAAAATAITADELIDLQEAVLDRYQENAIWIMSKKTRAAVRKLKNSDGDYILNQDATAKWGYTLFGKPVYVSDNMKEMAAKNMAVVYGDMTGLATKVTEDMQIEVLREAFATQHAVGVVGWLEADAKIADEQKIAVLKMATQ